MGFGNALGFKTPAAIGSGTNDCAYDGHQWPADKHDLSLVPDVVEAVVPPSVKAQVGIRDLAWAKWNITVVQDWRGASLAGDTKDLTAKGVFVCSAKQCPDRRP